MRNALASDGGQAGMSRVDELVRAAVLALRERRQALEDDALTGVVFEIRLDRRTGEARVVLLTPTYETPLNAWKGVSSHERATEARAGA